ncbi:hypothetical protein [Amycolatopsis decaplanina]|uniref:Integral membrane protein n=1 Tax=Amycolatopsis decaplanina DSM 44594 TaxID=1284240 RepID=M2YSL0_9PSEU|nr:hypothetical protein [Amycolatopsis decaplanina]EME51773.1 hypothetical protein H074_36359 [Amycolatopsis decaplanina DSM 44594]
MPGIDGRGHLAEFVPDASTPLDDLANSVHASAFDLVKQVLNGLGEQGNVNPAAPGFLTQYAAAAGLGLVVMAFAAIFSVFHGLRRGGRDDLRESLFKYLPLAVLLIVFSPAIGVLVSSVANAATEGITGWGATTIGQTGSRVEKLAGITADKLPGGAFTGLIVSMLIVAGALGIFLILAVEKIGLPVAGIIAGIGWGMLVHPVWRPKALRVPGLWLGLIFAKPLLFLLLAAAFGAFGAAEGDPAGIPGLIQLCLLAVALIVSSVTPLMILRRLPTTRTGAAARSSARPSAPVGVRESVAVSLERGPALSTPMIDRGPERSHSIEQAYEQRQREQQSSQRDRGQAEQRQNAPALSGHLEAETHTEKISSPIRGRA